MSIARIIVGVDGSDGSRRAVQWASDLARAIEAEVIAVHAIAPPAAPYWAPEIAVAIEPQLSEDQVQAWRTSLQRQLDREWCAPLRDAGVRFRAAVVDGHPAAVLMRVADDENAGLIVVGRRGHGGFAELVLGSVGHQLTHHAHRPVVVVPPINVSDAQTPATEHASLNRGPYGFHRSGTRLGTPSGVTPPAPGPGEAELRPAPVGGVRVCAPALHAGGVDGHVEDSAMRDAQREPVAAANASRTRNDGSDDADVADQQDT